MFYSPIGIAIDSSSNLIVADMMNNRLRIVSPMGVTVTLAGSGTATSLDGVGTAASFNGPNNLCVGPNGMMYVGDNTGHRIRTVTSSGVVNTLAGDGSPTWIDGVGTSASFHFPGGICMDSMSSLYVADTSNYRIRRVTSLGVVTTVAGSSSKMWVDGLGTWASFFAPTGICVDTMGFLYVTDYSNSRIRKVSPMGLVSTLAGSARPAWNDGVGTLASFSNPRGIVVDSNGNLYVADQSNNCIRVVTPSGVVTTLAGSRSAAWADGVGTAASFSAPSMLTFDASGVLYVTDKSNNRIRALYPKGDTKIIQYQCFSDVRVCLISLASC